MTAATVLAFVGTDGELNHLFNIEQIDVIGASPNELTLDGQSVVDVTDSDNILVVVHDDDDTVNYMGNWSVEPPILPTFAKTGRNLKPVMQPYSNL